MLVKNFHKSFRLNKKHYKPFLFSIAILFFVNSARAIEDSNFTSSPEYNSLTKPDSTNGLSLKALEIVKEPWNESSFGKSLSVLQDKRESIRSRQLILGKLNSNTRRLEKRERQQLLHNNIAVAKDANESPVLSAQAIRAMASISLMMYEKGEITHDEATSEKTFLIEVASDKRRDLQLRSSAIKSIEVLKINEAIPVLESLLSDTNNYDIPEIARSASISLTRLSGTQVFPYIHDVMKKTTNASVFETTAYCLGQMKTVNAMVALVQNNERFVDTGACDFALVDMEDVITDVLKQPSSPNVIYAIRSTKHLWKEGQKDRYIPLLYDLVSKAPNPVKREAVTRIISVAEEMPYEKEKEELSKILSAIRGMPQMEDYSKEVKKRLSAKMLTPQVSSIKIPKSKE